MEVKGSLATKASVDPRQALQGTLSRVSSRGRYVVSYCKAISNQGFVREFFL